MGRFPAGTGAYECGICWTRYDPALGDAKAQIAPGTAFADLPDDWTCPECAAPKARFLALRDAAEAAPQHGGAGMSAQNAADRVRAAYLAADESMRALPVHNARLGFETIGFRRHGEACVGIAITPWCMTLVRVPDAPSALPKGETLRHDFPSGLYEFVVAHLEGAGKVEICSLFSPMDLFGEHAAARAAAEAAMAELFAAQNEPETAPEAGRRHFTLIGLRR